MTAEREAMTLERQAFEEWYAANAFNYFRDPIGSRDCSLQWEAWQAALSRAAEPVGRVHIQLHHDCPSMRNVEFLEDIELAPGTHLLYTRPPEPARDAKDSARLDALEADIAKYGPITLHNGEGIKACQRGLGMANTGRTLRDAIDGMTGSDAAMAQEPGE